MKIPGLVLLIAIAFASCKTKLTPIAETEDFKTYIYKTVDTIHLPVNVYYPENPKRKNPTIVFYFGGGWRTGTIKAFHHQAKYLASRGMICVLPEYRVLNKHGVMPDKCIMDAKSAIRWVKTNAKALGVDVNKIVTSGGSAGGHLAACMGTHININDPSDDTTISTMPALMALFNPAINTVDNPRAKQKFGEFYKIGSPYHNVQKDCPPTIIFIGEDDSTTPMIHDVEFQKKLQDMGGECEIRAYPKQVHSFFNYGKSSNKYFYETLYELDIFLQKHGFLYGEQTIYNLFNTTDQVGEVSQTSAILQSRLTLSDTLFRANNAGGRGWAYFEISDNNNFENSTKTDFQYADDINDNIVKWEIKDLDSGTEYFYRLHFGIDSTNLKTGQTNSFKTLLSEESEDEVKFVMVTGSNYEWFYLKGSEYWDHKRSDGKMQKRLDEYYNYKNLDKNGFPTYLSMLKDKPDFYIGNGDNVYYDQPQEFPAKNENDMQANWHRFFSMPNLQTFLSQVPAYWIKDDHDYRYDDADTSTNREPGHELGIKVFSQQLPYPQYNNEKPYRTYRLNKYLQIWMVEGRDYRSPNILPDNEKKSIWGKEQFEWLKSTMLESDAKYKILVSPTPLVGPDDKRKSDNHTNFGGFQTEQKLFFDWLKENGFIGNGFYIICGDRHWQYHSIHPTGIEEFSCGAIIDENSRIGRKPGDPASTDPKGLLKQAYLPDIATGGYLEVVQTIKNEAPVLVFNFYNVKGDLLYSSEKK